MIASIRAGSRAMYAPTHENEIGIMDGPLILSPHDVAELRKQGEVGDEISPLWESTYGFSEAVRLLYCMGDINKNDVDERDSKDDDDASSNEIQDDGIVTGNWKEEEQAKGFYSFSSPQKTKSTSKPLNNKSTKKTNTDGDPSSNATTTSVGDDEEDDEETRLVLHNPPKSFLKRYKPTSFSDLMKEKSTQWLAKGKYVKTIWSEFFFHFWDCHPLLGGNDDISQFFFGKEKLANEEDDQEDSMEVGLDFDQFYAKTIQLPETPPSLRKELVDQDKDEGEGKGKGTDENNVLPTRVAHVKAYSPQIFQKLRSRFGVQEKDFIQSLIDSGPYVSFQSNSKGAARVGGFFFFSRDGTYMVKTIKKAEVKAILEMIPKYYKFMKHNAKRSLLTRFCGFYSVKLASLDERGSTNGEEEEERFFLIMNSVFPAESSLFISERFDLKGSTVGRECSKEERETKGSHAVLKDLDLAKEVDVMRSVSPAFKLPESGICIGPKAKAALLAQLRKDLNLLVECAVMDYSLLVGVVNMELTEGSKSSTDIAKEEIRSKMESEAVSENGVCKEIFKALMEPMNNLAAPAVFLAQEAHKITLRTLSTVLTQPFPYYGAGTCGVNGGAYSVLSGS
eukprot:CAMPEP_0194127826 /NCGR_PEP_ID=MMETSP0150-20130528/60726_1 /TAXON_ID=122233 /ORGANISM="Chaetoceros debilis, Strain MM31A-1" /LENGTH=620 /DNA_ID=CAMNT_0038821775 /DNA_START=32 /DNA_END=1891 /DNA_ORIENTATION=-